MRSDGVAAAARPLQLALEASDERSVGPMPASVVAGDNGALVSAIAPLYLTGSVLDVTYGRGIWWRRFTPQPFAFHDLAIDDVDFRELPHADRSWDTVCFDPPYIPTRGASRSTKVKGPFRSRYGLEAPRNGRELEALIFAGLAECARVARRWVLVKCCDYAENDHVFKLGHVGVILEGERLGLRVHDLVVHAGGAGPGGGRIRTMRRTRRAHSYLVVFRRSSTTLSRTS